VVEELPFSHPGPAYMLWSLPSRADITYALLGPKSQESAVAAASASAPGP
jgi:hypothetical protein